MPSPRAQVAVLGLCASISPSPAERLAQAGCHISTSLVTSYVSPVGSTVLPPWLGLTADADLGALETEAAHTVLGSSLACGELLKTGSFEPKTGMRIPVEMKVWPPCEVRGENSGVKHFVKRAALVGGAGGSTVGPQGPLAPR